MVGEIVFCRSDDGKVQVQVRLKNETLWMSWARLTELFQTSKQNISRHIRSIYAEGELDPKTTVKNYLTVQREDKREVQRQNEHYNMDMVISVGYLVKSLSATCFRIGTTKLLKECMVKGLAMDDEHLKNPPVAGSPTPA